MEKYTRKYKKKKTTHKNGLLSLDMQFFAENSGSNDVVDDTSTGGDPTTSTDDNKKSSGNSEDLDKLVQARADKLTAEMGKKNAALQKELEKLKKEKMTADELKAHEMSQKEAELAEKERMLLEKENRLLAIKAIQESGLDDGSGKALELIDFVMAENEDGIKNKVKVFSELVNKFVSAKVDKTFKQNGRNPNNSSGNSEDKTENTIAEKLGKARAEKTKQTNDVLKYYIGGNK